MKCPNCKREVSPEWKRCPYCEYKPRTCSKRGCQSGWLPAVAHFCPLCGSPVKGEENKEIIEKTIANVSPSVHADYSFPSSGSNDMDIVVGNGSSVKGEENLRQKETMEKTKQTIANASPSEPKIGDYYYSDGTYSSELINNKECVGVVFSLNTTKEERRHGWTHGYIIALEDAKLDVIEYEAYGFMGLRSRKIVKKDYGLLRWGGYIARDDYPMYVCRKEEFFEYRNDRGGYHYTELLHKELACEAFRAAKSFPVSLPKNKTSGWYLPAIGQLMDVIENLGSVEFNSFYGTTDYDDEDKVKGVYAKLNLLSGENYMSSTQGATRCFWLNCGNQKVWVHDKDKASVCRVRPVAAF